MKFKKFLSALIAAAQLSILVPSASFAANTGEADLASSTAAAAFADLSFTSEGIQDTSDYAKKWDVQPISYGNTPVSYNQDLNQYEAIFDNGNNFYKLILNKELRNKMTNGYSIQVYFNPSSTEKTMNVIGAAQTQGFDFEVLSGGHFDTCLNHGSGWVNPDGHKPGYSTSINANQYYLMTVTYDGSNIKVYQNNELKQTVASSGKMIFPTENQPTAKGDPYYGMVIGGDYNPTRYDRANTTQTGYAIEQTVAQAPFIGKISQVKLYEGALTADEVKSSYHAIETRKNMTILDDLNAMLTITLPQKQVGFEEDDDLKALIKEGWELMGKINITEKEVSDYLTKAQNYHPKKPASSSDGVKLRVGVLSDYQYGRNSNDSNKFKKALQQILKKAGGQEKLDALLLVGDISHNSCTQEYDLVLKDLEEILPRETRHPKIISIRGNHDAKEGLSNGSGSTYIEDSNKDNIKDRRDNFLNKMREYDPSILTTNGITEVNGYQFVYVSQDNQKGSDESNDRTYMHSPETVTAFEKNMKIASEKSTGKPMFVVMHPNAINTVYGSYQMDGTRAGKEIKSDFWSTSELLEGLKPYKNAITFSGHSHWTISHPRSVQKSEYGFYSLNTGAVNNMEIETCLDEHFQPKRYGTSNENESSGYYFEVKEDETVEIHKMDFYRNSEFGDPITINVNSGTNDGIDYTDNRDHEKPVFSKDDKVTVSDISTNDCKIAFPQATDQKTEVISYKAEYINQTTQATDKIITASSYYWLKGTNQEVTENSFYLKDFSHNDSGYYFLNDNTSYKVRVTAVDAYGNESDPIYSDVFTTKEKVLMPLDEATVASAFFTKNNLMDNSNYAVNNNAIIRTNGNTPISYNEELKRYETAVSKSSSCYSVLLPKDRYSLLQTTEGYTLETYFKPTQLSDNGVIIGAAQKLGFDIEYTADGTLMVYVSDSSGWLTKSNNSYPGSTTKLQANQYYHVTATVTPSQVNVYLNGELIDTLSKGSVFTPPTGSNMKNFYGFYIGGDYNNNSILSQNGMTGNIVFGKIYQRALTAKEVKEQYQNIDKRKTLTKVEDLKTILEETLPKKITEFKDPNLIELLNEGWLLMGQTALTDEQITDYLTQVNNYEPIKSEDDGLNLRFAVLGDYQYGRGTPSGFTPPNGMSYLDYTGYKVKEAIKQVIEKSKYENGFVSLDAIVVPGDLTHNGNVSDYEKMIQDLDTIPEIADGTVKMMFIRGNHDNNNDRNHDTTSNYYKYLSRYGVTGDNQVVDINGYKFIMMSQSEYGYNDDTTDPDANKNPSKPRGVDYLHTKESIEWFNTQLKKYGEEAKEEKKPLFITTHPGPKDTIFGSSILTNPITGKESGYWATNDFYGMERKDHTQEEVNANFRGMKDYQNVISFSGHSHWAIQNPRSIWQGEFTALNTGSVNNMEIESIGMNDGYAPSRYGTSNENESTGYYVTVDKNNIVNIEVLDLYRQQTSGEYEINVNDKDSWKYTDEKRNVGAPYFEDNAVITASNLKETSFTVNYPQAKDDNSAVNHYVIKVTEKETGKVIGTPISASSYYWLNGTKDQINNNTWDFKGLSENTEYIVEITPYNSYYIAGEPISSTFKTKSLFPITSKTEYDLNSETAQIKEGTTDNLDYAAHGMTVDMTKTIWTPKVKSDNVTKNEKALAFTTRYDSTNNNNITGSLFKLNFKNDVVIPHDAFTKGHYLFETEVGLLHKGNGNISMTLFGKNSSGDEVTLASAIFNGKDSSNPSKGYFINSSNTQIGSMANVDMGSNNDSHVNAYTKVLIDINLEEDIFSAWIGSTQVVEKQPLLNAANELSAVDFSIKSSTGTYGTIIKSIKVKEILNHMSAAIDADKESLVSGTETTVNATLSNLSLIPYTAALYIAAYDETGTLISITKSADKTITESSDSISETFTAPANTKTVKAFVWADSMTPLDLLTATK